MPPLLPGSRRGHLAVGMRDRRRNTRVGDAAAQGKPVHVFQPGRGAASATAWTCQPATWTWAVSGDVAVTTYSSRRSAAMPAIVSTSLPASILVGNSL